MQQEGLPCTDVLYCLTLICSNRLHVPVAPEVHKKAENWAKPLTKPQPFSSFKKKKSWESSTSFAQPGFVQEANLSWKGLPGGTGAVPDTCENLNQEGKIIILWLADPHRFSPLARSARGPPERSWMPVARTRRRIQRSSQGVFILARWGSPVALL